jgi:hypothetical protein
LEIKKLNRGKEAGIPTLRVRISAWDGSICFPEKKK